MCFVRFASTGAVTEEEIREFPQLNAE